MKVHRPVQLCAQLKFTRTQLASASLRLCVEQCDGTIEHHLVVKVIVPVWARLWPQDRVAMTLYVCACPHGSD